MTFSDFEGQISRSRTHHQSANIIFWS